MTVKETSLNIPAAVRLTPKSDDGPLEYDSEWPTTPNSCLPRC